MKLTSPKMAIGSRLKLNEILGSSFPTIVQIEEKTAHVLVVNFSSAVGLVLRDDLTAKETKVKTCEDSLSIAIWRRKKKTYILLFLLQVSEPAISA